jgi:hypothetical protein
MRSALVQPLLYWELLVSCVTVFVRHEQAAHFLRTRVDDAALLRKLAAAKLAVSSSNSSSAALPTTGGANSSTQSIVTGVSHSSLLRAQRL